MSNACLLTFLLSLVILFVVLSLSDKGYRRIRDGRVCAECGAGFEFPQGRPARCFTCVYKDRFGNRRGRDAEEET